MTFSYTFVTKNVNDTFLLKCFITRTYVLRHKSHPALFNNSAKCSAIQHTVFSTHKNKCIALYCSNPVL